jgi:hypothetical protein
MKTISSYPLHPAKQRHGACVVRKSSVLSDDEKLLIYFDDEEHIVRRLGAAVVSCWVDLAEDVQNRLLARAAVVFDDHESDHLEQQIVKFIAAHSASLRVSRDQDSLDYRKEQRRDAPLRVLRRDG